MKETPAHGTKGFLIWSPNFVPNDSGGLEIDGGDLLFRVYGEPDETGRKSFKDYSIKNYDLGIEITDKHASFFEDENDDGYAYIDYSGEYMGGGKRASRKELIDKFENMLGDYAIKFRAAESGSDEEKRAIKGYERAMNILFKLGWEKDQTPEPEADSQLPDEHMPAIYKHYWDTHPLG